MSIIHSIFKDSEPRVPIDQHTVKDRSARCQGHKWPAQHAHLIIHSSCFMNIPWGIRHLNTTEGKRQANRIVRQEIFVKDQGNFFRVYINSFIFLVEINIFERTVVFKYFTEKFAILCISNEISYLNENLKS